MDTYDSRPKACLAYLPPELKAQIVRELYFLMLDSPAPTSDPIPPRLTDPRVTNDLAELIRDGWLRRDPPNAERPERSSTAPEDEHTSTIPGFETPDEDEWEDVDEDERARQRIYASDREHVRRQAARPNTLVFNPGESWEDNLLRREREQMEAFLRQEQEGIVGDEEDGGDFRVAGLCRLSLVNREFAELCFPYIWKDLDFEDRSAEMILFLIKKILPRHAQHVESIGFGQSDEPLLTTEVYGPLIYGTEGKLHPAKEALIREAEEIAKWSLDSRGPDDQELEEILTSDVRARRARSLLLAQVIKMCPNIHRIDFQTFLKYPLTEFDEAEEPDIDGSKLYRFDHALQSVRTHLGPKLTDLTVTVNDDGITTERDVARLVHSCPNLLRIDLELYCGIMNRSDRTELQRALLGLRKLETLDQTEGDFIDDEFVQLYTEKGEEDEVSDYLGVARTRSGNVIEEPRSRGPWTNLQCLALVECPDLSFESFRTLVSYFSPTLRTLDLDGTPHSNSPAQTKKYLGLPLNLPQLETLVLSTPHDAKFLDSFTPTTTPRLREFSLGFCPGFAYADLERFVTLHQETLRNVEIAHDTALTQAQVESFEVWCHAKGIRCELLEDSDDEDDDDEDPSDFDPDDEEDFEGEGGWYDEDASDVMDEDDEDDLDRDV